MAAPERAAKRQRTLLSFGVCPKSHPRVAVSTEQGCSEAAATGGLTDSTQVQPASSTTSTASAHAADLTPVQHDPKVGQARLPAKRRFQTSWTSTYPWLEYDSNEGLMYCKLCREARKANKLAIVTNNFKTTTMVRHLEHKDHRNVQAAQIMQSNTVTVAVQREMTKREKSVITAMKRVYWMSKEGLPTKKYGSLLRFLEDVNCPNISDLRCGENAMYHTDVIACEFQDSIAHVIKTKLHKAVCNSITYSLITDESTDITVSKKLVIYCRLLNSAFLPETHFLSNVKVEDGTAAVITQELIKVLEGIGAQPSRLTGFGSDGASVMTGWKSGVAARLKSSVNEKLISIHCLAHKLALCSSQAAKQVEYINNYQETITGIFYFFKRSAVRVSKIEKIQELLDEPSLRYKEVHAVCWLSFYKALETVYRTWDSLVTFFGQDKDPKSKGFAKKLTEYEFVATTHLMMDAMAAVTEVSLVFQKKDLDLCIIGPTIDNLVQRLQGLQQSDQCPPSEHIYLGSLQKELQEKDGRVLYKGHALTAGSQKLKHFANVKKQFLEVLVDNICARFPQESKDLVHAFSVLGMRPLSFLNSEELSCLGNEQIDQLVDHYGCTKHDDPSCGDCEDQCNDDVNIVNAINIRSEWNQIKQLVLSQQYPRDSFAKLWSIIYTYHRDMFPKLIKIAAIALTLPVHSADCERGFSVQNNIKTYDRNRLGAERLNTLATIMVEGPDMEKFDFVSALSFWKTQNPIEFLKNLTIMQHQYMQVDVFTM
ncbi:uncharacterized protein C17orf113-like [Ptychodera flava]|uniref:uncharacterized protein C17orf113-like n=1 Tax=Ptychodera flava TaxID=63121 RepID=UPI00396AA865